MERVFRSLKSEWIPTTGYLTGQQAQREIGQYLMGHYNWIRPLQFNDGLAPAKAEEKLKTMPGMSGPLQSRWPLLLRLVTRLLRFLEPCN